MEAALRSNSRTAPAAWAVGVLTRQLYSSPIVKAGRWKCIVGDRESTAEQSQKWHMASFTHSGSFFVNSGRRRALIDSSCALLVKPETTYRMSKHVGSGSHGSYFLINPGFASEVHSVEASSDRGHESPPFTDIRGTVSTRSYILQRLLLKELANPVAVDKLTIEETSLHLFADLFHFPRRPVAALEYDAFRCDERRPSDIVEEIRALLGRAFSRPLPLGDLAGVAGLSPYYLCRLFKAETGVQMHRYRNRLRLRAVLDRIVEGAADFGSLALEFGFSSHSHLTLAFRREFGATPSEIRAMTAVRRLATLTGLRRPPRPLSS